MIPKVASLNNFKSSTGENHSILSNVPWNAVNKRVAKEQKNREVYRPTISTFRWWARRPHYLIGSILDAAEAAMERVPCISDPFSGGGTVALEAAQRGIPAYAQDLYPWPTFCLSTTLLPVSIAEFDDASNQVLSAISHLEKEYHYADGKNLTHIIRVRVGVCPSCQETVYLFPSPLVSLTSRGKNEDDAFWGCCACGNVEKGPKRKKEFVCSSCNIKSYPHSIQKGFSLCPHCNEKNFTNAFLSENFTWAPVLVQEAVSIKGKNRALVRLVDENDPVEYSLASEVYNELRIPIDDGLETRRLLTMGFRSWGDIYTAKQGTVILQTLRVIQQLDVSNACKDRIALAVIGTCEMAAFLCRWDRFHLKVYESVANHRYAHTTLTVETNLLGPLGRGTLHRRLRAARMALEWTMKNVQLSGKEIKFISNAQKRHKVDGVKIATGDSSSQGLRSGSVDLVLTDPPYYDDVQYGELARLFHFWLSQYKELPEPNESLEAVPNRIRRRDDNFYERKITECLSECYRTLSEKGKLVLTFHNQEMSAWEILCKALIGSGFYVSSLAVARTENSADLTKRNGKALLHDIVLECQKKAPQAKNIQIFNGKSAAEKVMVALGKAMTESINNRSVENLRDLFQKNLTLHKIAGGKNHVGAGFSKLLES